MPQLGFSPEDSKKTSVSVSESAAVLLREGASAECLGWCRSFEENHSDLPCCLSKSGFQWVSACGHVMSCLASSVRRKALMHQTDFLATGLSNGRRPRPPRTTTTAGRRRSWPISGVPTKTTNGVEPCRRDVTLFDTSHPCYGLIEASNIPKKRNTT